MSMACKGKVGIYYLDDDNRPDEEFDQKFARICEKFNIGAKKSPIHDPSKDEDYDPSEGEKKRHNHILFWGRIGIGKWSELMRECRQTFDNHIAFQPEYLTPEEIIAYDKYLTHETEASAHKQQFSDEEKKVIHIEAS